MEELYVYIHIPGSGFIPCGLVSHASHGSISSSAFRYGKKYLEHPDVICLDPNQLKLQDKEHQTEDGFSIFNGLRDASPDAWGRYLIEKKFPTQAPNELFYLAAANPDRIGALAFGPDPKNGPKLWTDKGWKKYEMAYLDLSLNAQGIEDTLANLNTDAYRELIHHASGSGGARPKATVIWNGRLHLAKFSTSKDSWNIAKVEYATMRLAKKCGIDLPKIHLARALDRDVFLIERFDRRKDQTPIHFISGLTITNIADNQYDAFKYSAICASILKHSSDYESDLIKLYKRMVFNIMVNNSDDHLRNIGFIQDQGNKWRLSPHYDVVPTVNNTGSYSLSLSVGRYNKEASLRNALSAIEFFRINKQTATNIISNMKETVLTSWKDIFKEAQIDSNTISMFENSFKSKDKPL